MISATTRFIGAPRRENFGIFANYEYFKKWALIKKEFSLFTGFRLLAQSSGSSCGTA